MRIDRFFLTMAAAVAMACQGAPKAGTAGGDAGAAPPAEAPRPSQADSGSGMHGLELVPPREKPDFQLTSTDGKPFDFRRDTEGYATLLFFGYTHCPDVCPLHLSNIAAVLHKLPPDISDKVRMVFVTTDPERDSAAVVRRYLDKFDRGFIGLVGTPDEILAAQAAAKIPPAIKELVDSTKPGEYAVGHAAFVFAYTPDGKGRFLYPFGVRQASWANDIPRLVKWPAGAS